MDRHEWDERYQGESLVWSAEPNRFLVAELEGVPPGRALDVACGGGRNTVWLAEQGWTVTGVDFSEVGLDKARRLAAARGVSVTWELADVSDYAPVREHFDLVIVLYLHLTEGPRRLVFAAPRPRSHRAGPCSWWGTTAPTPRLAGVVHESRPCCTAPTRSPPTSPASTSSKQPGSNVP